MTTSSDRRLVRQSLHALVGTWEGTGSGRFPTIDSFRYRERLEITRRAPDEEAVHYHQKAWLISESGEDLELSHWESGFLVVREDGRVEILNAQQSRRVEVLVGDLAIETIDRWTLTAESVVHGHDPRMASSRRIVRLDGESFESEVHMATTAVTERQLHLCAKLTRVSSSSGDVRSEHGR